MCVAPGSAGVQKYADSNTGNPGEMVVRELPSAFEAVFAIKEGFGESCSAKEGGSNAERKILCGSIPQVCHPHSAFALWLV